MTAETNARSIAIVLIEGFADWEHGLFAAAARSWLGAGVRHLTPGGAPVRSMGGLLVTPDGALGDLDPAGCDALVLIGSEGWLSSDAPDVGDLVNAALAAETPVGAICGATLALARAGALAGRRHTSNARSFLADRVAGYDDTLYVDIPRAVHDGPLVTAPGSAPASFATELIGLIWPGHPLAAELAALIAAEHRAT